ncbi:hypothetical protein [Klenkia soli]|uniref:hypothetical protein n=1 Tax=Klenkia soli TaxID=1052260 RepID=UPI000B8A411C|nr:hypothetical protein [Klenkia soli]
MTTSTTTTGPTVTPSAAPAPCHTHRRRGRIVGAAAVALAGASLLGTGAFSAWNATTAVSGNVAAGVVTPALVDANGGSFTTAVANLLPADYFYRYVDVRNDGSAPSTFTGTVTASGDLAGQVLVEATSCSVAWTAGSVCSGTTTALGTGTPTAATPLVVNHGTVANGASAAQHVRYKFTFSASAPSTLQGKTGSLSATVSNTAVGGNDRTGG